MKQTKHPAIKSGIYTLSDLKAHYERATKGQGHWFDLGAMRFFKSRLSEALMYRDKCVLFFSSEMGPDEVRRYSIREYNSKTGDIRTVGLGFQGYKTLADAKRGARLEGATK